MMDHHKDYPIGDGTTFTSIVWGMIFVFLMAILLTVPMESVKAVVEEEWARSTDIFGIVAVRVTNQIYAWFNIEYLMQELISFSAADRPNNDLEFKLAEWALERIQIINFLLVLFLLRSVTLVIWTIVLLPALGISLWCGWLERESNKELFTYTSPYKMSRWVWTFKLGLISLITSMLYPTVLNENVIPLILAVLAILSGKLISGLQKEI